MSSEAAFGSSANGAQVKKADKADPTAFVRTPSARTVARLLTIGRERLSKAETITVAAIENGVSVLVEAREIILEFQAIIRREALADLDAWIGRARLSVVDALANGVSKDGAAIRSPLLSTISIRPRLCVAAAPTAVPASATVTGKSCSGSARPTALLLPS
jgi:hypothetical protein